MGKEKLLKFEEGMEKFDKEFNLIFDIHLNHFMDALCYVGRVFSFDVIKFDGWAEKKGYQIERDGSLADWVAKKYGKGAKDLINKILGEK